MTSSNQLEFKGSIARHPVAELLVEFSEKQLSGSLRLSTGDKKSVIYVENGEIIFAVSNARCHRLYEILLTQNQIEKISLKEIEEFTNDLHLARSLVESGLFSQQGIDAVFEFQITEIINDALNWSDGEYVFSAAARIKSGISFSIDLPALLLSYLDGLENAAIIERFESLEEGFVLKDGIDLTTLDLVPEEAFTLSRLGNQPVSLDMLRSMSGLPSQQLLPIFYRFWFMGVVSRSGWTEAIGADETSKLTGAKFELKTSARSFEEELKKAEIAAAEEAAREEELARVAEETDKEVSLDEYLDNVENAATHYEIFGVSPDAKLEAIKKSYFSLAKRFHPDLFHRNVDDEAHRRVQNAFTEIAQAYETLKNDESREIYDFKLRKVIEQLREAQSQQENLTTKDDLNIPFQDGKAGELFNRGYDLLLKDKIEEALPYLARAVNLDDGNARYHAFYGRALTFDKNNQRTAEAELQQAVKLDPESAHYRLMLAELYVEIGLKVRAKGELNRLLEAHPKNKEATALLDTL